MSPGNPILRRWLFSVQTCTSLIRCSSKFLNKEKWRHSAKTQAFARVVLFSEYSYSWPASTSLLLPNMVIIFVLRWHPPTHSIKPHRMWVATMIRLKVRHHAKYSFAHRTSGEHGIKANYAHDFNLNTPTPLTNKKGRELQRRYSRPCQVVLVTT